MDLSRAIAPAIQPVDQRVGSGFAASRPASVAGRGRETYCPVVRPAYDPSCYLCPGNSRAGGMRNPQYSSTFVFENDFAALTKDAPTARTDLLNKGLIVAEGESGICRVMCFSPRHDISLSNMDLPCNRRGGAHLDLSIRRTRRNAGHQPCADLREPRRNDGRQQSSSPLPDLGHPLHTASAHARTRLPAQLFSET